MGQCEASELDLGRVELRTLVVSLSVLSSRGVAVGGAVAAATPLSPAVVVGVGGGLDHAPGRGWWADRQTDVRGLGPQFGYSQKGALD